MSLLALLAATGGGGSAPTPNPPITLGADVHIQIAGNSISNDHLASGMDDLINEALGSDRNGATISTGGGTAVNGTTWQNMRLVQRDHIAAAYDDAKTHNILVVAETGNSIFEANKTVTETTDDARAFLAAVRADHPWTVVLWGNPTRGHGDFATYPGDEAKNEATKAVDDYMAANYEDMGAAAWVTPRGIPQFSGDGSTKAEFRNYVSAWSEVENSNIWDAIGWVHPANGTFTDGGTPATGKRAIAELIAATLKAGVTPL